MTRYRLIVLVDDEHIFSSVVRMLMDVLGIGMAEATRLTEQIDRQGEATVLIGSLDEVEAARRTILGYGLDPAVPSFGGPMAVRVEAVE